MTFDDIETGPLAQDPPMLRCHIDGDDFRRCASRTLDPWLARMLRQSRRQNLVLVGLCVGFALLGLLAMSWRYQRNPPCSNSSGPDGITGRISNADRLRVEVPSLRAREGEDRVFPPGQACRLYGIDRGASGNEPPRVRLLAEHTYPDPSEYLNLLYLLLLPIPFWFIAKILWGLARPHLAARTGGSHGTS